MYEKNENSGDTAAGGRGASERDVSCLPLGEPFFTSACARPANAFLKRRPRKQQHCVMRISLAVATNDGDDRLRILCVRLPGGTRDREQRREALPGGSSTALFRAVYRETGKPVSRCAHHARRPCPFTVASAAIFLLAPHPHSSRAETRCHVCVRRRIVPTPRGCSTNRPSSPLRVSLALLTASSNIHKIAHVWILLGQDRSQSITQSVR